MIFAAQKHDGAVRKASNIPYILHPMEAAAVAATITDDQEVLAATVLHDVMEDCGVSYEELLARFGARVADLVQADSHNQGAFANATWDARKREAVRKLAQASRELLLIVLSDKLSNIRAIHRDYLLDGDAMFLRFNQTDKRRQAWYYRSCAALTREAYGHTAAWQELNGLVEAVFSDTPSLLPENGEGAEQPPENALYPP